MKRREAEELLEKKLAFIDSITDRKLVLYVDGKYIEVPVSFESEYT